ncbi:MAG TPA: ParB/RepB/Spo0J family partition protein [Candidatus Limnocylindria bacterium]|nr:ParB/RepB/Spo0J family partition protein [Candidatus Limnocylindria bacterium]
MHRKALGRGLEALIPGGSTEVADRDTDVQLLLLEEVGPNPFQPRTRYDPEALNELAASIKATGVLQPVLVRHAVAGGYELVAGERRLRAARAAGLERIPALLRQVGDDEMMELALIENIQREDLNPIDEAKAYQTLIGRIGLTHDQISERVGKQRSTITNALRLLGLPVEVQEMVSRGTLSSGHARALLGLETPGDQLTTARYAHSKAFSVRRTEAFVRRKLRRQHSRPKSQRKTGLEDWENKLQQKFATHVTMTPGRKGGKVEFEYYGQEDLERLLEAWGVL